MPVKGSAAGERLSVMTPGWHEDSTGKWYQNPDGTYYVNGFADIDGTTYSFDKKGIHADRMGGERCEGLLF